MVKCMTAAISLVEAERRVVEKKEAALATEERRLGTMTAEVGELTAKLGEADPDSRAFDSLAQEVGAGRTKLEALVKRRDRAAAELKDARRALVETERAEKMAELEKVRAEIAERSSGLTACSRELARTIETQTAEIRELSQRADELAQELGGTVGAAVGCPWIAIGRPLQLADEITAKTGAAPAAGAPWGDLNASPASWGFRP
jgi:hypothetical protein